MPLTDASFKADAVDHVAQPPPPTAAERRGLTIAIIAAAALHILIPAAILAIAWFTARPSPPLEEIPVEVVVEKPQEQPKPQENKPKPPEQPQDEKPAYDAPSAATAEKANRESPDEKTSAPEPKPEPAKPAGTPEESKTPAAASEAKSDAAPIPQETPPSETADLRAAPKEADDEAKAAPEAPPTPAETPSPPPAPALKAPPGAPPPSAEMLPDPKFAHAATESPVIGGHADTRYLTIVYGMIRDHYREPRNARPTREGSIMLALDEGGNLVERKVLVSSGSAALDTAMLNAIAEAAPYPAPPGYQPMGLRLVFPH